MVRITEDLIRKRAEHNELMVGRRPAGPVRVSRTRISRFSRTRKEISDLSRNQIFRNHEILKLN